MQPQCDCKERYAAMRDGTMLYRHDREGWMFTDLPIRRMSPKAAYLASERGVDNCTGEPFIHITCPFCGLDLPLGHPHIVWNGDGPE